MPEIFDVNPNLEQSTLTELTAQGAGITATAAALGNTSDAAATSDTQNTGIVGLIKRLLTRLTTLITSAGNLDTNVGARADTVATSDTGTFSLVSLVKKGLSTLTTISTNTGAATQSPASTSVTSTIAITASTSAPVFTAISNVKVSDVILLNIGSVAIDICYAGVATSATKITTLQPGKGWTHNYSGPIAAISVAAGTLQATRVTG